MSYGEEKTLDTPKFDDLDLSEDEFKVIKDVRNANYTFMVLLVISGVLFFLFFGDIFTLIFSFTMSILLFYFNREFMKIKSRGRTGLIIMYVILVLNYIVNVLFSLSPGSFIFLFISVRILYTLIQNQDLVTPFQEYN